MRLNINGDGSEIIEVDTPAVIVTKFNGVPVLLNYGEYHELKEYMSNYEGLAEDFDIVPKLVHMPDINDFQDVITNKYRFMEYFKVI